LKRVFIFSYHGNDNFHTSYYRLKTFASYLSKSNKVVFFHGSLSPPDRRLRLDNDLEEITLAYKGGFWFRVYSFLIKKDRIIQARLILLFYYFFTGYEIFDLKKEVINYLKNTDFGINPADIVLVSYPSWNIHELGVYLKEKYGCKLILDFRDPGVFGYKHVSDNSFTSFLRKTFMKKKEIKNLDSADLCITISEEIKKSFPEKYRAKFRIVSNGGFPELIDSTRIDEIPAKFQILYLGSIYKDQLKSPFFNILKEFIRSNNLTPADFGLCFVGTGQNRALKKKLQNCDLERFSSITSRVPIEEAYKYFYSSNLLLHLRYGERSEVLSSKHYDYLISGKPILMPEDDHGPISESISRYKSGFVCQSDNEISKVLQLVFDRWKNGYPITFKKREEELYKLSRNAQAEKLSRIINDLS
jgi:hypothetical protein